VTLAYNHGNFIKAPAVKVDLTDQTPQTIAVRLDLVRMHATGQQCDIRTRTTLANTELLD